MKETKFELLGTRTKQRTFGSRLNAWLDYLPTGDLYGAAETDPAAERDRAYAPLVFLAVLAVGLFYLGTIRAGHDWEMTSACISSMPKKSRGASSTELQITFITRLMWGRTRTRRFSRSCWRRCTSCSG